MTCKTCARQVRKGYTVREYPGYAAGRRAYYATPARDGDQCYGCATNEAARRTRNTHAQAHGAACTCKAFE